MKYVLALLLLLVGTIGCGSDSNNTSYQAECHRGRTEESPGSNLQTCQTPLQPDAESQPQKSLCFSILAAQQSTMPCDWIRLFGSQDKICLAYLHRTFGDSNACLIELFKNDKPKLIKVYLSNGSAERKNIADDANNNGVNKNALEVMSFLTTSCPTCDIELVLGLEDNWTADEAIHLSSTVRRIVNESAYASTKYILSRNPVNHNQLGDNPYNYFDSIELHGTSQAQYLLRAPCSWSNDGEDLLLSGYTWNIPSVIDIGSIRRVRQESLPHCDIYLWQSKFNCLDSDSSMSPLPMDRDCSGVDSVFVDTLIGLLR